MQSWVGVISAQYLHLIWRGCWNPAAQFSPCPYEEVREGVSLQRRFALCFISDVGTTPSPPHMFLSGVSLTRDASRSRTHHTLRAQTIHAQRFVAFRGDSHVHVDAFLTSLTPTNPGFLSTKSQWRLSIVCNYLHRNKNVTFWWSDPRGNFKQSKNKWTPSIKRSLWSETWSHPFLLDLRAETGPLRIRTTVRGYWRPLSFSICHSALWPRSWLIT